MQRTNHNSERGQAVVIIVVAMVVLLGFTALAVDGSMVYSDRRHAQSAADSSSLAGGTRLAQDMESNNITNSDMYGITANCANVAHMNTITSVSRQAAKTRAGDNDFVTFNANMTSTQLAERSSGALTGCGKEAITGLLASGQEAVLFEQYFVDLQTQITNQTETAFAHLVYGGKMENTVTATTRVFPRQPLAYGYAIVALNKASCSGNKYGMQFEGMSGPQNGLLVKNGGIFSNGCMDNSQNTNVAIESTERSGFKPLSAFYFTTAQHNTLGTIKFSPSSSVEQLANIDANRIPLSTYDVPVPDCSGHEVKSDWVTGYYASHNKSHIPAGLYCVTDQLKINKQDIVKAEKVTFILLNGMDVDGGATVDLQMRYPSDPQTGAIAGLLFYQPRNIIAGITFNGNSDMTLRGSWIAPGADIKINGNDELLIFGQIVGYNVFFSGSANITVEYRQDKVVTRPARLELHQ